MYNHVHKGMHKGLDLINEGIMLRFDIWQQDVLFSWRWWLGVGLVILSWGAWFLLRKKNSSDRLFYSGLFVMVISLIFDSLGMQLALWQYIYPVFPLIPAYLPYDLALLPVAIMFLIQVKPRVKAIYKAVLFALLTSYVGEPFFIWISIYDPMKWKHIYSFIGYLVIYLIANWLSKRPNFNPITIEK